MSPLRPSLALALLLALLAAGALAVAGSASPPANGAAVAKISPIRVDGVHLGDTHADLRARGKVGRIRPGCELAENTRTARLLAPLHGAVNYTQSSPRRVDNITVVRTPKRPSGGQITFAVSTQTKRTTMIGVPFIAFCE
jgi:hypothetical protein